MQLKTRKKHLFFAGLIYKDNEILWIIVLR